MNTLQKIFVMVAIGSTVLLIISIFGLGYGLVGYNDTAHVDISYERFEKEAPGRYNKYENWKTAVLKTEGIWRKKISISSFFKMFIRHSFS